MNFTDGIIVVKRQGLKRTNITTREEHYMRHTDIIMIVKGILRKKVGVAAVVDEPCKVARFQCINSKDLGFISSAAILKRGDGLA
jgi:hypothetical protein